NLLGRAPPVFRPTDRRAIVAVTERKAVSDEFLGLRFDDRLAHFLAGTRTVGGVFEDFRVRLLLAIVGVAHVGMGDIATPDRLALDLIAVEETRAAPARERRGKLPAEIDRVAEAGIEAKVRGW